MFFFFQLIRLCSHLILRDNIYLRIGISVIYLKCIIFVEAGRTQHQYLLYALSKNISDVVRSSYQVEFRAYSQIVSQSVKKFHLQFFNMMKILLLFIFGSAVFCNETTMQENRDDRIPTKILEHYWPVINCLLERESCTPVSEFLAGKFI